MCTKNLWVLTVEFHKEISTLEFANVGDPRIKIGSLLRDRVNLLEVTTPNGLSVGGKAFIRKPTKECLRLYGRALGDEIK